MAGRFAKDFLDGMRDLGYVDGRDIDLVARYAEGFHDRLPALAQEMSLSSRPSSWPPPSMPRFLPALRRR